ncbi:MAG: thiamine pyrophosphate-dependent enzyme, partial [Bacillota bacterium]|nr:thiamine pyrophosphate-dependent enzyme [Bacillota bacterium]
TRVIGLINQYLQPDDIAVGSSGSLPGDLQRLWRSGHPGTYHLEYAFSCMGYEVCGALGVKMACPDREVYAFLGDGSYLMLHSELYTAVQEGLKINLVIMDNSGWGCIENLQNSQGSSTFGTVFRARGEDGRLDGAVLPINFAANARSYGAVAYTIRSESELLDALSDARHQVKPCVFDIKVLPGSMTHGYESWWRVGVAEVSNSSQVADAHAAMAREIDKARPY